MQTESDHYDDIIFHSFIFRNHLILVGVAAAQILAWEHWEEGGRVYPRFYTRAGVTP